MIEVGELIDVVSFLKILNDLEDLFALEDV